jgi:hypothetical protein
VAEFSTVAALVSDVAGELSLVADDIADPYASEDPNILQLCRMLKAVGREIVRKHLWSQALRSYTFVTTSATTYALPADFLRMINQTQWNRTTRFPLGGPLSPQEWEYLTARAANVSFRILFRPRNRLVELYNGTNIPSGQTIAYEYLSSYWVQAFGQTAGNKVAPTLATDTILFDAHLMTRALKFAFLRDKGFDASNAKVEFDEALAAVMRDDTPAPTLSLNGPGKLEPLIGEANVPITGYG